jgi:hypothetical protein
MVLVPVGCEYSNKAYELRVRSDARIANVAPPLPPRRPPAVLLRLAYLTLCRSIQLLALLAHGDTAKDLEILVLHHQLTVLRARFHDQGGAHRPRGARPLSRAPPPLTLVLLVRNSGHAAALASAPGRRPGPTRTAGFSPTTSSG